MPDDLHEGHRERLKRQFLQSGLDSLSSHQVLELLLFYAIPRRDTNPLAHMLLNTFGSLPAVLDAPVDELCHVKGISEHSAALLSLCGKLIVRYHKDKRENCTTFYNTEEVGEYLQPLFMNESREKAILVCLNNRWDLLDCSVISTGSITHTDASTREIIGLALRHHATNVLLAHNHPAGFAVPSNADLSATRNLVQALAFVEVRLVDHLIFSQGDFVSLRASPSFAPLFASSPRKGSA